MSADVEVLGRELNEALDRLIRRAGLPRVHQRLNAAAGVSLDRSSYWLASWLTDAESLRLSDKGMSNPFRRNWNQYTPAGQFLHI